MEIAQTAGPVETFEQFMAGMRELRKFQEEVTLQMKETDRKMQETDRKMQETDRQMQKMIQENAQLQKETDRQVKETSRKISELGSRFGEMTEYMILPNLVSKFQKLGFEFTKAYPEAEIKDEKNRILAEIDITLENGDKVMIVEVKTKPSVQDVKDHIKRMEKVRRHADLHNDRRKFLGAVAGMVVKENVREFILKTGFYIIEPSGESFNITEPTGKYHPSEW